MTKKKLHQSVDKSRTSRPKKLFNVSNLQRKNRKKVHKHKGKDSSHIEDDSFEENFLSLSESETAMSQEDEESEENVALPLTSSLNHHQQQQQEQHLPQPTTVSSKKRQNIVQDRYQTRSLNNTTYYNIYHLNNRLYIGNDEVKIDDTNIIIKKKVYKKTPGLMDLLMMTNPASYSLKDLDTYKQIIVDTNCHKLNFDSSQRIVRNLSEKYKSIIQFLFPHQKGGGIDKNIHTQKLLQSQFMIADNRKNTYTYWDNPNELVERLRLLIASQSAGHTGHTNEIISIIEELKEAKIIQ